MNKSNYFTIGVILAMILTWLPLNTYDYAQAYFTLNCYQVDGMAIFGYGYSGWEFIGAIANEYDSDSIANEYGMGSEYRSDSINNEYGRFGSPYRSTSAFNDYASKPPIIINDDYEFVGYLTTSYKTPSINTYEAISCAIKSYKSFSNSTLEDIIFKDIPDKSNGYSGYSPYGSLDIYPPSDSTEFRVYSDSTKTSGLNQYPLSNTDSTPYIAFNNATDNISVTGYYLGVSQNSNDDPKLMGTFQISPEYSVPSLLNSGTYYIIIRAVDAVGNISSGAFATYKYEKSNDEQYISPYNSDDYSDWNKGIEFSGKVLNSIPNINIARGESKELIIKIKNMGKRTWASNTKKGSLRLGTTNERDHKSIFYDSDHWLVENRAAEMKENSVKFHSTATFSLWIKAPTYLNDGIYYEKLRPVAEFYSWFDNSDINLTINVSGGLKTNKPISPNYAGFKAQFINNTGNTVLSPGEISEITFTYLNSGTETWYKNGEFPIRLGTLDSRDRPSDFYNSEDWLVENRLTGLEEDVVLPDEQGNFKFIVQAPDIINEYNESFGLVSEFLTWFENSKKTIRFTVK